MGLGKTPEALAIVQKMNAWPALVICPASLKYNWQKEAIAWVQGMEARVLPEAGVPIERAVREGAPQLWIINYDVLEQNLKALKRVKWGAVVIDESHYLKSGRSKRTLAVLALMRKRSIRVRLLLTGTPAPNRIEEMIAQLKVLRRLDDLGGFWHFAERYCGAKKTKHGWDLSGRGSTESVKELHERLRATCFVRRRKAEVLAELPPKQRVTVPILLDNAAEYIEAEADIVKWLGEQAAQESEFARSIAMLDAAAREAARGSGPGAEPSNWPSTPSF